MKGQGVAFEEFLIPFDDAGGNPKFRAFSPNGKVPVLWTDDHHLGIAVNPRIPS